MPPLTSRRPVQRVSFVFFGGAGAAVAVPLGDTDVRGASLSARPTSRRGQTKSSARPAGGVALDQRTRGERINRGRARAGAGELRFRIKSASPSLVPRASVATMRSDARCTLCVHSRGTPSNLELLSGA